MSTPQDIDWGIVVPVKGGPGAKSRLHSPARGAIATAVALDTIATAVTTVGATRVLVVTGDRGLEREVRTIAPVAIVDDPGTGLDAAALAGVSSLVGVAGAGVVGAGAPVTGVAVLLGDHPCLTERELRVALEVSGRHTRAFVPDAHGTGTAMVTTTRPGEFASAFGAGSAARHQAVGMVRLDLELPGLRLDVDDLDDLDAARGLGIGPRTRAALLDYATERAGEHPHGR